MRTLLVTLAAALFFASTAGAADRPHPTLDAAASYVAGKPVHTFCQTSQHEWDDYLWNEWGLWGSMVNGYTMPWKDTTIYLSPRICLTLLLYLEDDWRDTRLFGTALHTLIHEAVHQQGSGNYDEHDTDCKSLTYTRDVAMRFFNVPEQERYTYTYLRHGKNGRLIPTKFSKVEPSKFLRDVVFYAQVAHNTAPAPYSGECS